MLFLKWMVVPCAVLAIAVWFGLAAWFANNWIAIVYYVVAVPMILVWRRATYCLIPSVGNVRVQDLDDRIRRKLKERFVFTCGAALSIMIGTVVFIVAVPWARTASGGFVALTIIAWTSLVQFGAYNVLTHQVLQSAPCTNDVLSGQGS